MWTLRNAAASPFGRKVRIAAAVCGLEARIETVVADTTDPNDPLRRQQLLEELSLKQRLRLLLQYLREETGNAAA